MCVQIIHDQSDFDCIGISFIDHLLDLQSPVLSGTVFSHSHASFAGQGLRFHENFRNAFSDVFVVNALRLPRFARYRLANLPDHLLTGLVHAHRRIIRIVGQMIDSQNILHRGYERGAPFRRDFPVLAEVRLKFVFFKTRCTVMCDTDGAKPSSTALSARSLTVHHGYPSGASEQAKATNLA